MSPVLKIALLLVFIGAAIDLVVVIKRIVPMINRVREIKRIKTSPDVISVEAEIIEIHEQRLDELDIQYTVKLYYEVGYQKFYKDFILINKQSLRVGQKLTVLCDSFEPEKALIQNFTDTFGESYGLKSTIFNLVLAIIIMIVDAMFNMLYYTIGI